MRCQDIPIFFITNNSSKMPSAISKKLNRMGIDCDTKEVISSGMMAVEYCKENEIKEVFVSGSDDLIDCFINSNIEVSSDYSDFMVIGMDSDFDYYKLTRSVRASLKANTILLCNEDRLFLKEDGVYPGCGGMTSSILYCSNRKPDIILGKPCVYMAQYVSRITGLPPEELVMIGDTFESDVLMAKQYGSKYFLISDVDSKYNISGLIDTIGWDWSTV